MMRFELDVEKFWRDDEIAHRDNCFFEGPQVALGIRMSMECVYAQLGEPGHPWMPEERERALDLRKRYNDVAEKTVGMRLLEEGLPPADAEFPYVRRIGEVFGGRYEYQDGSEWLVRCIEDEDQLLAAIQRAETLNYRAFMLPANWAAEKKRIHESHGLLPAPMRGIRGPVTLACSLMGTEDFLYLMVDNRGLAERFSRAIAHAALSMAQVMDEEAGVTPKEQPGYGFADDNCCLLTPEMYEAFGYPVLKALFDRYSPNPEDGRYQHSDSAMGHLLPILGKLDLNGVNFGPTVLVPEIRNYLPRARIDGCIAPLDFMRNDEAALIRQTTRDCLDGLKYGGVNLTTAGSINNGSTLESMRLIMSIIQAHPRAGHSRTEAV